MTFKQLRNRLVAQHHKQGQPNSVKQQPKKVQVEVLYVHASVHILLQGHLVVDRGQTGDGDAAYCVHNGSAQDIAGQAVCGPDSTYASCQYAYHKGKAVGKCVVRALSARLGTGGQGMRYM